jgi:hypothetical protein
MGAIFNPFTGELDFTGAGGSSLSDPVTETHGGTNQTSYAKGDFLQASAANTLQKLAIGSQGQILKVLSTGLLGYRGIDELSGQYRWRADFGGIGTSAGLPPGLTALTSGTGSAAAASVGNGGAVSNAIAGFMASGVAVYAGATATSWSGISGDARNSLFPVGLGITRMEFVLKILNLSKAGDRFITTVGFCPAGTTTAAPTDGLFFTQVDNVSSGHWVANGANASSTTPIDTGIAATTGLVRLGLVSNAAGTSWQPEINGVAVGSPIVSNIPASTTGLSFFCQARNTAFTSQINEFVIGSAMLLIDYTTAH